MKIFEVKVNEYFNIKDKTGIPMKDDFFNTPGWDNPFFIYTFKHLKMKRFQYDTSLKLKYWGSGQYQFATDNANAFDLNTTVLKVLVMEGDDFSKNVSLDNKDFVYNAQNLLSESVYKNIMRLSSDNKLYELYDINIGNDFTFDISDFNCSIDDLDMIFMIKDIDYIVGMTELWFELEKITDTRFKVKCYQTGSVNRTISMTHNFVEQGDISYTLTNTSQISFTLSVIIYNSSNGVPTLTISINNKEVDTVFPFLETDEIEPLLKTKVVFFHGCYDLDTLINSRSTISIHYNPGGTDLIGTDLDVEGVFNQLYTDYDSGDYKKVESASFDILLFAVKKDLS